MNQRFFKLSLLLLGFFICISQQKSVAMQYQFGQQAPAFQFSTGDITKFAIGIAAFTAGSIVADAFLGYSKTRVMQKFQDWDPTLNGSKSELGTPKKKVAIIPKDSPISKWLTTVRNNRTDETWYDLFRSLFIKNNNLKKSFGYTPSKCLAFMGPSGIGKSKTAEELARRMGAQFLYLKGSDIVTKQYVNSGVPVLDNFLKKATKVSKKHPTVAFIDEFGLQKREEKSKHTGFDNASIESLLNFCNNVPNNLTVIIASNMNPEYLDPALTRYGRFQVITMGLPDEQTRLKILKKLHSKDKKLYQSAYSYLPLVAKLTEGFTGSELEALLENAARIAEENYQYTENDAITEHDIDQALLGLLEDKMKQCARYIQTKEINDGTIQSVNEKEKAKEKVREPQEDLEAKLEEQPEYRFYKETYNQLNNKKNYMLLDNEPIKGSIEIETPLYKKFYRKFNNSPYVKYPVYGIGLYGFGVYGLYRYRNLYLPYLSSIAYKTWTKDFSIPLSWIEALRPKFEIQ